MVLSVMVIFQESFVLVFADNPLLNVHWIIFCRSILALFQLGQKIVTVSVESGIPVGFPYEIFPMRNDLKIYMLTIF